MCAAPFVCVRMTHSCPPRRRAFWEGWAERGEAASALTRAAVCASTPADELLVCLASEQLGAHEAAYAMLSRSLKRCSGRYPVLYDLAVCLLKLGRLEEASRSIHLCRELDPDDVPGEVLFNRMMDMETRALTPEQVRCRGGERILLWFAERRGAEPVSQAGDSGRAGRAPERWPPPWLWMRSCGRVSFICWPCLRTGRQSCFPPCARPCRRRDAQRLLRQVLLADPRGSAHQAG